MAEIDEQNLLTSKIATILDETKGSNATHNRKLKELSNLRSSSQGDFFPSFCKALAPIFTFQRRTATAERVVRFVASFSGFRDPQTSQISQDFLEEFLRFLLSGTSAANKTARSQACHIISETILRLPDDVEVNEDLWDEVIEIMKTRVQDKVPAIRIFAVRTLSRFVNDSDNIDILELFLDALASEQNADVRKTLVLSLPPSTATSTAIIDCTLDVSESVRKAAFFVLANKFPIQSLSIKLRTVILQRGLSDRSPAVVKECMKLLQDEWLIRCCNSDPVELLKFLDVETYETVGNSVVEALLRARILKFHDDKRIQELGALNSEATGTSTPSTLLLEPEVALYWRAVCWYLKTVAEAKSSDAASTMGAEAAVYAAEATDNHDFLEKVLPETISHYVEYVKLHLAAGPNYQFAARQLLLLGGMLDYSDATNWKAASTFVHDLLHRKLDYEVDDSWHQIVIGDGINIGGDREWATAVSTLAKRVHSAAGEFEEILLSVIDELGKPCRERTADYMQWMHCLAVTGLLLENTKSLSQLQGKAIEPLELLQSLLLPGARHLNLYVKRVAIRCIGLYGLLERKPNEELVKQLRVSFASGPSPISAIAAKALIDNVMWHGPQEIDRAHIMDFSTQEQQELDANADMNTGVLYLLYSGFEREEEDEPEDDLENVSLKAVLGEGFAKLLLLSENYPSMPADLQSLFLSKLIHLYFINENVEFQRLKQCLSVFFEHYPCLSSNHKKIISKSFIPVLHGMWPGVNGYPGGSNTMVSNMRKRAVQVSRFFVQMMQASLYAKEAQSNSDSAETLDEYDCGEEGLAIRIAVEVLSFNVKKTAAEKAYVSALCKAVALLQFRASEQGAVKVMRQLLSRVANSVSHDKIVVKDLQRMSTRLKALDTHPDQELSPDLANVIFGRLEVENPGIDSFEDIVEPTQVPRSTRPTQSRRRVRNDETSSDEEGSPTSVVPAVPAPSSVRSQRASKTAALTKLTAKKQTTGAVIEEEEDEDLELASSEEEENSDVTSEDEFDGQED